MKKNYEFLYEFLGGTYGFKLGAIVYGERTCRKVKMQYLHCSNQRREPTAKSAVGSVIFKFSKDM